MISADKIWYDPRHLRAIMHIYKQLKMNLGII